MTLTIWLEIFAGVLKFPGEVRALLKILRDTPAESNEKIVISIGEKSQEFARTGRPKP